MVRDETGAAAREARLLDVSLSGARLELRGGLREGSRIVLEVKTPNLWDPLAIESLVAWSSETADASTLAGLKFVHRSPSKLAALFDLLADQDVDSL